MTATLRDRLNPKPALDIIRTEKPGVVLVQSASSPATHYVISGYGTPFAVCTCPAAMNGRDCKHLNAALETTIKEMEAPMSEEMTKAVSVATRSTALVRAEQNRLAIAEHMAGWETMKLLAAEHIKSGYAPAEVKTPEQGALIIQKAMELDIPITSAYAYIDVIKGRPALRGQMIGALVDRSGKGTITVTATTASSCTAEGRRDGRVMRITCDLASFANASNPVWKTYPADLLRWKAIARVGRVMFADVICGMEASDGSGGVVDSMYSVEDAGVGRVEIEHAAPGVSGEEEPSLGGSTSAPAAASPEPDIPAEFTDMPPTAQAALTPMTDEEALFLEFLDALNANHATPGALSLAMKADIGSGQWCPENAVAWVEQTGVAPTELVLRALAARKAS